MILTMKYVGTKVEAGCATSKVMERVYVLAMYSFCVLITIGVLGLLITTIFVRQRPRILTVFRSQIHKTPALIGAIFGVAALVVLTQLGLFASVNLCTNPAYAHMIVNFNVILVLIGAIVLFHSPVNWTSALGIVLGVIAITLVVYGESRSTPGQNVK